MAGIGHVGNVPQESEREFAMQENRAGGGGLFNCLLVGVGFAFAFLLLYLLSVGPAVCLAEAGYIDERLFHLAYMPVIALCEVYAPFEVAVSLYVELFSRP